MSKLGVCSWILGISDINALMEKVKMLGLDGVQLNGDWSNYNAKEVIEAADLFDLEIFASCSQVHFNKSNMFLS